jgi:hypothetical protein
METIIAVSVITVNKMDANKTCVNNPDCILLAEGTRVTDVSDDLLPPFSEYIILQDNRTKL